MAERKTVQQLWARGRKRTRPKIQYQMWLADASLTIADHAEELSTTQGTIGDVVTGSKWRPGMAEVISKETGIPIKELRAAFVRRRNAREKPHE